MNAKPWTAESDFDGLIAALERQRQIDEDGIECGVSRQAVHEAISAIAFLRDMVRELAARNRIDPVTRLLPCPFCGRDPAMNQWDDGATGASQVVCENDDCTVKSHTEYTRAGVKSSIDAWNTRTAP